MACDTCHYWKQIAQAPELPEASCPEAGDSGDRRRAARGCVLAQDEGHRVLRGVERGRT
jgi:hypothetical protein